MADTDDRAARAAYAEKLRGLSFGFTHSKADFHGPTIRERQRQQEADATAAGINWTKLSTRKELI